MNWQTFSFAALVAAFFSPAAVAREGIADWPWSPPEQIGGPSADKATLPPITGGIANPGFESGVTGWTVTSYPALRTGSAPEGANHLSVQNQNYVGQRFALDLPTWQSFTVRLRVLPEFSGESAPLYLQSFGSTENTVLVPRDSFPRGGQWQTANVAYTRVPGATELLLILRSRAAEWWQGVDDLQLLFEGIDNGGFEADAPGFPAQAWQLEGGAAFVADDTMEGQRALSLPPGAIARQDLSHTPYAVHYFVAGRGTGSIRLAEERFTRVGAGADSNTTGTLLHLAAGEAFLWEPGRSATGNAATVVLANESGDPARVDQMSRGWTLAWPEVFEPIANSPIPTVRLAAAWPGELDAAEIDIVDGEDAVVRTITELTRDGTSAWVEFDGDDLPAGEYSARFRLSAEDGRSVALDRRFTLRRGEPFLAEPSPISFPTFQSMPWLFFDDGPEDAAVTTPERAEEILRLAKEDGFTLPLIICPPGRLGLFVAAAEAVDIPFVLATPAAWLSNPATFGNQTFDPEVYRQTLDSYYGPYLDHPLLKGLMLVDEVNLYSPLPTYYNQAQVYLERLGYPPGFTFLGGTTGTNGTLPPIHTAHLYTHDYEAYRQGLEDVQMPLARNAGRQFWFGPTAWSQGGRAIGSSRAASSIFLGTGLAMGADGYYAFLYTTLNYLGGIRTAQFGETRRAVAYREFNHRVAALAPVLEAIGTERERPSQENVLVRVARDGDGRAHAFVVNQLESQSLAVSITTARDGAVEDVESGSAIGLEEPLQLGPGEWRLLRFDAGVEPLHFAGVAGEILPLMPAAVRILRSFTAHENNSRSIAISPDGRYLSTMSGNSWYLYDLAVAGATPGLRGSRFLGTPQWTSTSFLDNQTVLQGSSNWGLEVNRVEVNGTLTRLIDRTRVTTGGHAALRVNETEWWSTHSFIGASRLSFPPGDLVGQRIAHLAPRHYGFLSLHGPLNDGSVIAVDYVHGPYRLRFDGETISAERLSESSAWAPGSMSPSQSRFAFGREDRGVSIHTLREDDTFTSELIDDPNSQSPNRTEWLDDENLIVVDRRYGLFFYRMPPAGGWEFRGMWQAPSGAASSVATTAEGMLAVGTTTQTIYLLDASAILNGHPSGWMLLGE